MIPEPILKNVPLPPPKKKPISIPWKDIMHADSIKPQPPKVAASLIRSFKHFQSTHDSHQHFVVHQRKAENGLVQLYFRDKRIENK